jgi:hypothetical protein
MIDDGELDRVQAVLERMPLDWLRCAEPDSGVALELPQDLIISSGPRSMRMPTLMGAGSPIWVCIYDQDFLPLRERLRDLGVHFLVSGELAPHAFELFLRQLLNNGEERRRVRRIPLQCDVELSIGRERSSARMLELSRESCVISARRALKPGQPVSLQLPAEYTSDSDLAVTGTVIRATATPGAGGNRPIVAVVRFDASNPHVIAHVQALLSGNVLGTLVTPLRDEPHVGQADADAGSWVTGSGFEEVAPDQVERRGAPRRNYDRRIEAIRWQRDSGPAVLLGKDLSLTGLCIAAPHRSPVPPLRSEVRLALHGRVREEPLVVRAEVVRRERDEIGLRFLGLATDQIRALERMLSAAPVVEELAGAASARHVLELAR